MAEKRMFTGKITESDAFLDMPLTSQCFYFHLCMYADDEGFVKNPKRIQRMIGASDDDMRILLGKNFVISYESGVIVIKHWKMHNAIRKDRLHETEYQEEKALLYVKENGAYTLDPTQGIPLLSTKCPSDDGQMSDTCHTEIRLGLDKNSIDKNNKYTCAFSEFWENYPRKKEKSKAYKCYKARLNDGYSEDELLAACINYAAECEKNKTEERYIKLGATFLGINEPFADYLKGENCGQGNTSNTREREERERGIDEVIRRIESGEADHDDDGLWDGLPKV